MTELSRWLAVLKERAASDLFLAPNQTPRIRVFGKLSPLEEAPVDASMIDTIAKSLLGESERAFLERTGDVRVGVSVDGESFRAHFCRAASGFTAVFHHRSHGVSASTLQLPDTLVERTLMARGGLTLVAGPGGSGKSSTALCLVEAVAAARSQQIVVVETPVEVRPQTSESLLTFKSVGLHAPTLRDALTSARDEGADLIYISDAAPGPDLLAMLEVATSGPQIIATMTAPDTASCLEMIANAVGPTEASGLFNALSEVLVTIVTQHLLPLRSGDGMVPAFEILVGTAPAKAAVREGRVGMLGALIQTGQGDGMRSLDAELGHLLADDRVALEDALIAATDPESLAAKYGHT